MASKNLKGQGQRNTADSGKSPKFLQRPFSDVQSTSEKVKDDEFLTGQICTFCLAKR